MKQACTFALTASRSARDWFSSFTRSSSCLSSSSTLLLCCSLSSLASSSSLASTVFSDLERLTLVFCYFHNDLFFKGNNYREKVSFKMVQCLLKLCEKDQTHNEKIFFPFVQNIYIYMKCNPFKK